MLTVQPDTNTTGTIFNILNFLQQLYISNKIFKTKALFSHRVFPFVYIRCIAPYFLFLSGHTSLNKISRATSRMVNALHTGTSLKSSNRGCIIFSTSRRPRTVTSLGRGECSGKYGTGAKDQSEVFYIAEQGSKLHIFYIITIFSS